MLARVGNAEARDTRFAYGYAHSAEAAYAEKWRNYQSFDRSRGLDDGTQPLSVAGERR